MTLQWQTDRPVEACSKLIDVITTFVKETLKYQVPSVALRSFDGTMFHTPTAEQPVQQQSPEESKKPKSDSKANFLIEGMSCASCAASIETDLKKMDLLSDAAVNFATLTAVVTFTATLSTSTEEAAEQVAQRIRGRGYGAKLVSLSHPSAVVHKQRPRMLMVEGMSCASCAARIEGELKKMASVAAGTVNFATSSASILVQDGFDEEATLTQVVSTITELGFGCKRLDGAEQSALGGALGDQADPHADMRGALSVPERSLRSGSDSGVSLFTVPLVVVMLVKMGSHHASRVIAKDHKVPYLVARLSVRHRRGILWVAVLYSSAQALRHRTFTMDTLVSIGVGTAYVFSVVGTILDIADATESLTCYYDSAAMLVTFMLLGRYLRQRQSDIRVQP